MLAITKDCGFYTVSGMTVESWLNGKELSEMKDVVVAIEEDDPLFKKVINAPRFDIIYGKNEKFVDIEVLPPLEPSPEEEAEKLIITLKEKLNETDYKVIKNEEVRAFNDASKKTLELPYNPVDLHEERQAWREKIEELEQVWEQQLEEVET